MSEYRKQLITKKKHPYSAFPLGGCSEVCSYQAEGGGSSGCARVAPTGRGTPKGKLSCREGFLHVWPLMGQVRRLLLLVLSPTTCCGLWLCAQYWCASQGRSSQVPWYGFSSADEQSCSAGASFGENLRRKHEGLEKAVSVSARLYTWGLLCSGRCC